MPPADEEAERKQLELAKLRWELSFWARAAAVAIPIAAFVVAVSQGWIAWRDTESGLALQRIETAVKMVDFTNAQTSKLHSTDIGERTQALTYASELLPPEQACTVINAVIVASPGGSDFVGPAINVRALIAERYTTGPEHEVCIDQTIFKRQNDIARAMAQAVQAHITGLAAETLVQPAEPAHAVAAICPPPSDKSALPLVVYYQVVQPQDREPASRIGFEMPTDFPSAGTEYVAQKDPTKQQPQVRFYYPAQEKAAEYLACLLNDAYNHVLNKQPAVPFKTVSIAGKYNNLPPKRVEVWFPALPASGG